MKRIKIVLSFILMFALSTQLFVAPAFATSSNENAAPIVLSDEEVAALDLAEFDLIDTSTITAFLDKDGKIVDIIEGDVASMRSTVTPSDTHFSAVIKFYKSGSTYYVSISVTAKPNRWWVETVELSVLPTGLSDWMTRKDSPGKNGGNTYNMPPLAWRYPNGSPTNVSVDVKYYVHTAGEWALEDYFAWSLKFTMENP